MLIQITKENQDLKQIEELVKNLEELVQRYTRERYTFVSMITKSISLKMDKQDRRKQMSCHPIEENNRLKERIK